MTLAAQTATDVVHLKHHYQASIEQVYAAWTEPDVLGKWFGPHSHQCQVEKFDLTEGGKYQLRLIPISGEDADCTGDTTKDSVCAGQFVQIIPTEKLVMTFNWIENGADMDETLLSIEFFAVHGGTDVTLTHERIPDEELRQAHMGGWQGALECLEEYLQTQ